MGPLLPLRCGGLSRCVNMMALEPTRIASGLSFACETGLYVCVVPASKRTLIEPRYAAPAPMTSPAPRVGCCIRSPRA